MASVKAIFKEAITASSIRGLGNTVGHDEDQPRYITCIWVVSVALFVVSALVGVVIVSRDYHKYPTSITQEEFVYFQNERDSVRHIEHHFPTVTICNANPLANGTHTSDVISYGAYLELVKDVRASGGGYGDDEDIGRRSSEDLQSLYGYFSFLGVEDAQKAGHDYSDFVISCELLVRKYFVSVPCVDYVYQRKIMSPNFFNCYLIGLDRNSTKLAHLGIPRGFVLTLYVGSIEYSFPSRYPHGRQGYELDTGVLLALQSPGKYPDLWSNAYRLAPGFHHHVAFSSQSRVRLGAPYAGRDCMTDSLSVSEHASRDLFDLLGQGFRYSHETQIMSCMNKALLEQCSCLDPDFPVVHKKELTKNVTYCGDIKAGNINVTMKRLACMHLVEHHNITGCAIQSPLECTETIISSDLSAYAWPRPLEQLSFYNKYIKNREMLQPYFKATYDEIERLIEMQQEIDAKQKLLSANLIKENFVKITIEERSCLSSRVEDSPKWKLAILLSQIGGILNLWGGISIVVLVELTVLVVKLIVYSRRRDYAQIDLHYNVA